MKSNKTEKLTVNQCLMQVRTEMFRGIIYDHHARLLHTDKGYFKSYCKRIGISEPTMRLIMDGTYDGTITDLVEISMKAGFVPIVATAKKIISK